MAEAAADLFGDDPDFHPGDDPVEHVLSMMFAGWVPPTVPEPATDVPDTRVGDPVA